MSPRRFGDFWAEWQASQGLPTKVVVQPIPTVPVQSDPDIQISDAPKPLRIGQQITCNEPAGIFRPCHCGSTSFTVLEGKGPHAGQLACNACHKRGRWLSRAHLEAAA